MEEHPVTQRLQETRERIRAMLIPDPDTGRIESRSFPRSTLMRVAFDARARKLAVAGASLAMLFAGRRRAGRGGWLPLLTRSLGSLAALARR